MYTPPKATKNTQKHNFTTKLFLLVFFTAVVASSLGFVKGQQNTLSSGVNSGGQVASSASSTQQPSMTPTCLLTLDKTTVRYGDAVHMKWQTQYATGGVRFTTTTGANVIYSASSGGVNIYPKSTGNITITAKGTGSNNICSKTVSIAVYDKDITTTTGGIVPDIVNEYPPHDASCVRNVFKEGPNDESVVIWSCPTIATEQETAVVTPQFVPADTGEHAVLPEGDQKTLRNYNESPTSVSEDFDPFSDTINIDDANNKTEHSGWFKRFMETMSALFSFFQRQQDTLSSSVNSGGQVAATASSTDTTKEEKEVQDCSGTKKDSDMCKDKCITSYVFVKKKGEKPTVVGCPAYDKKDDLYKRTAIGYQLGWIFELLKRCGMETPKEKIHKKVCIDEKYDDLVAEATKISKSDPKCSIDWIEIRLNFIKTLKAINKTSATKKEAERCAFKGSVDCTQKEPGSDSFKCKPKPKPRSKSNTNTNTNTNTPPPSFSPPPSSGNSFGNRLLQSMMQSMMQSMTQSMMQPMTQPMTQPSTNKNINNGSNTQQPSITPTCLLVLNKTTTKSGDAVYMKWQTQYATGGVEFTTTTGANVNYSASSGGVNIYPKSTGNITITAKGTGSNNTCSKTVNIAVYDNGTVITDDEYSPLVSCIPSVIEEGSGDESIVTWSCSAGSPVSSTGSNIYTDGSLTGTAYVYPTTSTEYGVSCLNSSGEVIGSNSCTVLVEDPMFDIIVWPETAGVGDKVRITWGSLGMGTCRVTGPNNFLYDQQNGVVTTIPFTDESDTEAIYTIQCASVFGGVSTSDIAVDFAE